MKRKRKHDPEMDDEELIDKLRSAVDKLPDDAGRKTMELTHLESIRVGLDSRGDPFERDGTIILSSKNLGDIRIPVDELPVTLGTHKSAGRIVNAPGISRRHCHLERKGPFVRISDAGSTNGTFVNDRKIRVEYLCEGDKLTIGKARFVVLRG